MRRSDPFRWSRLLALNKSLQRLMPPISVAISVAERPTLKPTARTEAALQYRARQIKGQ